MKKVVLLIILAVAWSKVSSQIDLLKRYNVIWNTPSENSMGSMPIGNGDIGANVWVDKRGDVNFYISKTDLWSENGQLLKLGLIKISLDPAPSVNSHFSQELLLGKGMIHINYGNCIIDFRVDANNPAVLVNIESSKPIKTRVSFNTWRKKRRMIDGLELSTVYGVKDRLAKDKNCNKEIWQGSDVIIPKVNSILWYHHNDNSHWKENMVLQSLGDFMKTTTDPLLERTFGGLVRGKGMISESDTALISSRPVRSQHISITILTDLCNTNEFEARIFSLASAIEAFPEKKRLPAHESWWKQFWERSYIFVSSEDEVENKKADAVTRGYVLQRYINACAGRGKYPIKFNGSIFTVDCFNRNDNFRGFDADFRHWGGPYWWQNTRLPYWTMLISGDFDLMKPFFGMYFDNLALRKFATRKYYQHEGAFFPETMNFWGTYTTECYGCDRTGLSPGFVNNRYIRYYWQGSLEMSMIMFDYYSFTGRGSFARDTLIPYVTAALDFFNSHWQRGEDGKILFTPAMSLETFHSAVNPLPEIAGIRAVAQRFLDLDLFSDNDKRRRYIKLINDLPSNPQKIVENDTLIAPAGEYGNPENAENPELYSVFPYRQFGIGKTNLDLAMRTYRSRTNKENSGWQQNSIQAAYLGLSEEAASMIFDSFSHWDSNFRFPAFWGPNYDWTPDQDHGSVAMNALQRMIIQYDNGSVHLLPSWPEKWNVIFRVNAPDNMKIEGEFRNGKVINLKTNNSSQKVICHKNL